MADKGEIAARIAALQAEIAALEKQLGPQVSPLAPKGGFPALPVIDGVRFAAVAAGVKYQGRLDVMLAEICDGAAMAGVFTTSKTRSAPVLACQESLATIGTARGKFAILVNSGNSNAFTGDAGWEGVHATRNAVGAALGIDAGNVFCASTGVIGVPLPYARITAKIEELVTALSPAKAEEAARAIMTTDTFAKGATTTVKLGGDTVRIAGFAKGSGMIAPDMATMLVYIFTDAAISQPLLQGMVSRLNARSFNAITVDSDTSTSDSLVMAATGKSGMAPITEASDPRAAEFEAALGGIMRDLAHQVVRDGEGATKFVEVNVTGAESDADAHTIGLAIANSPLVKTAIAGEDPNWGRVVMAIGKSGAAAERDKITIRFGDILVAENGWVAPSYTEADGAAVMKRDEITINVDLGLSAGAATVWTCDLTHRYITINADYRS